MMATYDEILVEIKEGRRDMTGGYKAIKEDLAALEAQLAEIKGMTKDQPREEGDGEWLIDPYNTITRQQETIDYLSRYNAELIEKNRKLKKKIKKLKRALAGDFA